jgi:hypothetical protein
LKKGLAAEVKLENIGIGRMILTEPPRKQSIKVIHVQEINR